MEEAIFQASGHDFKLTFIQCFATDTIENYIPIDCGRTATVDGCRFNSSVLQ